MRFNHRVHLKSFNFRTSQGPTTDMMLTHPLQVTAVLTLVLCGVATQQCGSEFSIFGMMLQRHTFKEIVPSTAAQCLEACSNDVICQSFHYVISQTKCELNNRTKEARPEYFRPDPNRYYYGLVKNRGKINFHCFFISSKFSHYQDKGLNGSRNLPGFLFCKRI